MKVTAIVADGRWYMSMVPENSKELHDVLIAITEERSATFTLEDAGTGQSSNA